MKTPNSILSMLILLSVSSSAALSQLSLPTKSISIFKNGSCMITKEGTVPLKDNMLRLPVPNAINSTYWLSTPGERLIKSINYKNETLKVSREVASVIDLLELNIGKTIQFETVRYASTTFNGAPLNTEPRLSLGSTQYSGKILGVNRSMNSFKMDDKNGVHFFDCAVLREGNYSITDAIDKKLTDSTARYAIVRPTKTLDELHLQEISLQSGIQWIPSYHMRILNGKEVRVEMKALIENYSNEDILDAETEVVVGVPQLYFSTILDPAVYGSMTQLSTLTPSAVQNNYLLNSAREMSVRGGRSMDMVQTTAGVDGSGSAVNYNISYQADAEESNDIFVYKLGGVTIDKNSKSSFPVFATTVEYKDIHECDIPDQVNFEMNRTITQAENTVDVFHSLELKNTSGYPLTTAGTVVTDEKSRFLAQDLLKYIPKGGRGRVRLAKELNVTLKNTEEELNRTDNIKKISRISYGRATLKGTVSVDNFDDKEMTISVKKHVNGTVLSSPDGKVKRQSQRFGINPQSEISWSITIPAGEHRDVNYEYESVYRQ